MVGEQIKKILNHDNDDFLELTKLAGLNPRKDFRHRNLLNIDFSGMDLSKFDFFGSNLDGCRFYMTYVSRESFDEEQLKDPRINEALNWSEEKRLLIAPKIDDQVSRSMVQMSSKTKINVDVENASPDNNLEAHDSRSFQLGDFVSYPKVGIGRVVGIENESILDFDMELYLIEFDHMVLRVPTKSAESSGMRPVVPIEKINYLFDHWESFETIDLEEGRFAIESWHNPYQKFENMINSGDLFYIGMAYKLVQRIKKKYGQDSHLNRLIERSLNLLIREICIVTKLGSRKVRSALISGSPADLLKLD